MMAKAITQFVCQNCELVIVNGKVNVHNVNNGTLWLKK
jgi:hypothetical protein